MTTTKKIELNNIFENLLDSFVTFLENIPFWGYMVVNGDDKDVINVSKRISRKQVTFGESKNCNYQISNIRSANGTQSFQILDARKDKSYNFLLNIPGKHNVFNAAGSIAVALEEDIEIEIIQKAISEFSGVGRRYEKHSINIASKDIILIDDYGHHPTEVEAVIKTAREVWPDRRLVMVYQPHRYSRTKDLFDSFVRVLSGVDALILLDVYAAGEERIDGADSKALAQAIRQRGQLNPIYAVDTNEALELLPTLVAPKDVLVVQGAGNVNTISNRLTGHDG